MEINPEKETFTYVGRPATEKEPASRVPFSSSSTQAAPSLTQPSDSLYDAKKTDSVFGGVLKRTNRTSDGSASNRASFYASGTQSATVSRETSPERLLANLKKPLRLPPAPPSMIITPSHTPGRAPSVERGQGDLTSTDMRQLYQKLSAIESEEDSRKALMKERGGHLRVLLKSTSVDNTNLETPSPLPTGSTSRDYSPMYASNSTIPSVYDDAPQSETLPASIRVGALMITPGVERLTSYARQKRQNEKRSASVSPKTARRQFYEDYEKRSAQRTSKKHYDNDSDISDAESLYETKSLGRPKRSSPKSSSRPTSTVTPELENASDTESAKGSSKGFRFSPSSFFDSIREKRRLFGSKRAASVDNAAIRSEAARMGITIPGESSVKPSASTSDNSAPADSSKGGSTSSSSHRRWGFYRRAGSVEPSTLQSSEKSRTPSTSMRPLRSSDRSASTDKLVTGSDGHRTLSNNSDSVSKFTCFF